jgi:trehalose synthase
MTALTDVTMPRLPLARLDPLIGSERAAELAAAAEHARDELDGSIVWNVSSTAVGGGVAEMLRVLVGYILDADVDIRWCLVGGDPAFFDTTKRIHNQLHAFSFGAQLSEADAQVYRRVTEANGRLLAERVRPRDVVLLHDPQTAGLAPLLADRGALVIWRCHVGTDRPDGYAGSAWELLRPYLEACDAFVFSRRSYAPSFLDEREVIVIPPSIDPFSEKNRDLTDDQVRRTLIEAGVVGGDEAGGDGAGGGGADEAAPLVRRRARVVREGAPLDWSAPLVVQVSRWDRLKDMPGVMRGFLAGVPADDPAHLLLVGPDSAGVSDDPEGAEVFGECQRGWAALDGPSRRRVSLVCLPLDDVDENALMVNAIQRHATVVVQKSLAEGFGLTVAEAMWKGRPVVASAVGGIADQVTPETGVLLEDPSDLEGYGAALRGLLADPARIDELGRRARERVLDRFVGDRHLIAYAQLIHRLRTEGSEGSVTG